MAKPWATLGFDLHVEPTGPGLCKGLTKALREAVRSGRLAPGTRLPSSRTLAADLGIARNTVADAYADLVAEGWLTALQGSGTRVAERTSPEPGTAPTASRPREVRRPAHDEHVAVVAHGDGRHALTLHLGEHRLEPLSTVEHRVFGVIVQVNRAVGHRAGTSEALVESLDPIPQRDVESAPPPASMVIKKGPDDDLG